MPLQPLGLAEMLTDFARSTSNIQQTKDTARVPVIARLCFLFTKNSTYVMHTGDMDLPGLM